LLVECRDENVNGLLVETELGPGVSVDPNTVGLGEYFVGGVSENV